MKIEAHDKEIQDIFSLGYFQIPRFQRPYSWERDEVENFWNDVVNEATENYFIGSMVVYQSRKPYFGIVDGQQRLTTITLMLAAVRNAFNALGEANLAKGVHKYIEKPNIENSEEFVIHAETSFPYLQDHIQSFHGLDIDCEVGVEEQNLKLAFELITNKLVSFIPLSLDNSQSNLFSDLNPEAIEKLKVLRDKILSLKLVFIQLDNEEDAYLIFETLNARGRDLKTSDLVKNLLLKKMKSANSRLDSPKESWNSLVKKFDDTNDSDILDAFLLHYWISEHAYTTDKKLFSEISQYVSTEDGNAAILLKKLVQVATIYCKLLHPSRAKWSKEEHEIKESLIALNTFKVKQQYSMILALLRSYEDGRLSLKNLKNSLRKIEFFHFVFNAITSQRSSGTIATTYSNFAIKLTKASSEAEIQSTLNSLFESLKRKIPGFEEFEVKFVALNYLSNLTKNKPVVKYALSKQLGENANGLNIQHESLTIEHLLPETKIRQGVSEELVGNIGNLILTDSRTNAENLASKDPVEKINFLREINYPLGAALLNSDKWDQQEIKGRAKGMAKALYYSVRL
ncbi:DUF262 domain-containing protein [Massilia sp. YIM B02443]|uniref:DUF262 domain-containing protein n=1 Tax=Massilia sp. YIM B02443 TaxID=3050127 RepID=UPI0025B6FC8B|nr:DUF262 domain-containing protein [Massilia sp. YIM B02443]MDN4037581.1 DUF262 domain-containing protein [Massilia sp. YIM B02443]